jgi:hypothetical protein
MVDCLEHHEKCKAVCCRFFTLTCESEQLAAQMMKQEKMFVPKKGVMLTKDYDWYMKLHGVTNNRHMFIISTEHYRIERKGRVLVFWRDCDLLRGNLCSGYPDNRPALCKVSGGETKKPYLVIGKECGYYEL